MHHLKCKAYKSRARLWGGTDPETQIWPPARPAVFVLPSMLTVIISSGHPGIITTGSTLKEYQYYVSAYQIHFSSDGEQWEIYREANSTQDKVTQAPDQ